MSIQLFSSLIILCFILASGGVKLGSNKLLSSKKGRWITVCWVLTCILDLCRVTPQSVFYPATYLPIRNFIGSSKWFNKLDELSTESKPRKIVFNLNKKAFFSKKPPKLWNLILGNLLTALDKSALWLLGLIFPQPHKIVMNLSTADYPSHLPIIIIISITFLIGSK